MLISKLLGLHCFLLFLVSPAQQRDEELGVTFFCLGLWTITLIPFGSTRPSCQIRHVVFVCVMGRATSSCNGQNLWLNKLIWISVFLFERFLFGALKDNLKSIVPSVSSDTKMIFRLFYSAQVFSFDCLFFSREICLESRCDSLTFCVSVERRHFPLTVE